MGKAILLLLAAALIGTSITALQNEDLNTSATERQAERQAEQLAREVARSGYNYTLSLARQYEANHPGATPSDIIAAVAPESSPIERTTQGGHYVAYLEPYSLSSFRVVSEGFYQGSGALHDHLMEGDHLTRIGPPGVPTTPPPGGSMDYQVDFEFIESQAGWCSAIYMQRFEPNTGQPSNNTSGHGQTTDDYVAMEPELVFAAGKNRDGAAASHTAVLKPGTLLNFVLAVDKNCSLRDQVIPITG
ncbi:MAG: hypothetical protein AAGI71_19555, partial [Bacteroidota bacterium]